MTSRVATVFESLSILGYLAALGVMVWSLRQEFVAGADAPPGRLAYLTLGALAVTLHSLGVLGPDRTAGPNISFLSALSLVMLGVNAILLLASLLRPVDKLGVITFPLAAIILLLKHIAPEATRVVQEHSWPMQLHIVASLLAYSVLNIAALQALLLAVQDACLRRRHPGGLLVRSLPSLQSMETLMFQLLGAGLVLLTVSLVTGFVFLENLFAQHLAHKTILSLLAWLLFAVLLVGRSRYGWRGQTAIRWTLSGFAALMLAYFGSKLVLELILNRA